MTRQIRKVSVTFEGYAEIVKKKGEIVFTFDKSLSMLLKSGQKIKGTIK